MNEVREADIYSIKGEYTYDIIFLFPVLLYNIFVLFLLSDL